MADDFVLYSKRPEWQDVTPIPQDDGPNPVCPIAYSHSFQDTHDYFRAMLQAEELSARGLQLSTDVILINAANYTAWYYRRQCLQALAQQADWQAELQFCRSIALDHQKNYQVWHHRSVVLEHLNSAEGELDFCKKMLVGDDEDLDFRPDSKNYHVWSFRQFVVSKFGLWEEEARFAAEMIEADVRNNSAWNQRHFSLTRRPGGLDNDAERHAEMEYALAKAKMAPNNQSAWNYLAGVARDSDWTDERVQQLEGERARLPLCAPVRSLLMDIYLQQGKVAEARALCEDLIKVDSMRVTYWNYRLGQIAE